MAVLTNTHNLCFEQKYENYQNFSPEIFHLLVVKFPIYLYRRVSVKTSQAFPFRRRLYLFALTILNEYCLQFQKGFHDIFFIKLGELIEPHTT